eukprot:GAHX01000917.1.p1 GENE.GAHX01000917.1~~GAHX01000917.1.p1  ORF type:complete len:125 (+),score=19.62 GAHX01000917.1:72-446(+)
MQTLNTFEVDEIDAQINNTYHFAHNRNLVATHTVFETPTTNPDYRSVYVYNIGYLSDEELIEYFCQYGPVYDLFILIDLRTKSYRDVCYVEFYKETDLAKVLKTERHLINRQCLQLKPLCENFM